MWELHTGRLDLIVVVDLLSRDRDRLTADVADDLVGHGSSLCEVVVADRDLGVGGKGKAAAGRDAGVADTERVVARAGFLDRLCSSGGNKPAVRDRWAVGAGALDKRLASTAESAIRDGRYSTRGS